MLGGSAGQRFSNDSGRGIAIHTNTAIAVSQQASKAFMAAHPVSAGNCRIFLSPQLTMLATWSAQMAKAFFTSRW